MRKALIPINYLIIVSFILLSCTSAKEMISSLNQGNDSGNSTKGSAISLTIDSPFKGQLIQRSNNFLMAGSVTGNRGAYCWVFLNEDNQEIRFGLLQNGKWSFTNNLSVYGSHNFKLTAVDAEGNASSTNEITIDAVDINKHRNIVLQPPFLPGNPYGSSGLTNKIILPLKQSNGTVFTAWRFDTNGDGNWDTVWTNTNTYSFKTLPGDLSIIGEASNASTLTAFTNNRLSVVGGGTGSFSEINAGQLAPVNQSSIAFGDIDGDSDLDLILTGYNGTVSLSKIYRNGGTGNFTEINPGQLSNVMASSIALGDIDGDSDLDLIMTGCFAIGTLTISRIYQNDGTGSFTEINPGQLHGVRSSSIALGDIDGDGDLDLILTGLTASSGHLSKIYQNDGTGSFTEINPGQLTGVSFSSVVLGDIDGDYDLDLILTGINGPYISRIYRNDGTGSFTEINPGQLAAVDWASLALGDIDGDTDLDLVLTGYTGTTNISKLYRNSGTGSFTEIHAGQLREVWGSSVAFGDLDADGDLDLILVGHPGTAGAYIARIYRNDGTGSFTEINPGQLSGAQFSSAALGDIDKDGDLDLIITGYGGTTYISKIYQNQ